MQKLKAFLEGYPLQKLAMAFKDLDSGREYLFAADESFHPASTFKVAVMLEAFHRAALGDLSLDASIPVVNSFTSLADGSSFSNLSLDDAETSLYTRVGGTESLRELVRLMIVRSSNLATNILIQLLGAEQVTAYLRQCGIEGVTVRRGPEDNAAFALGINNAATARGLMQMMALIGSGRVVSAGASREMEAILLGQEFNEGLPAGLPAGTPAAHKTGWNDRLYHDFGILRPADRAPYVLAVMTEGFQHQEEAHSCVAAVSRLVYEGPAGNQG